MADFCQFLTIFYGMHHWKGVGWGGWWQKLKQRSRMTRVYKVDMMSTSIQLQGVDRHVLTVGTISVANAN